VLAGSWSPSSTVIPVLRVDSSSRVWCSSCPQFDAIGATLGHMRTGGGEYEVDAVIEADRDVRPRRSRRAVFLARWGGTVDLTVFPV